MDLTVIDASILRIGAPINVVAEVVRLLVALRFDEQLPTVNAAGFKRGIGLVLGGLRPAIADSPVLIDCPHNSTLLGRTLREIAIGKIDSAW